MRFNNSLLLSLSILLFFAPSLHGAQFLVTPRISLNEQYYHKEYKEGVEPRDHDLITLVSPGFNLDLLGRKYGVKMSYDAGFAYYKEENENNATRHDGRLQAWMDLTKNTSLSFTDALFQSEDPGDSPDGDEDVDFGDDEDGTVRRGRFSYLRNTATLKLTHRLGKRNRIGFSYLESFLRNDDPAKDDNNRHVPSLNLVYWFTRHWGIEADTSYTMGRFDEGDDQDSWDSRLKLMRKFTKNLDGFLQYRHSVVDYDGETENYSVYNPTVGFRYRFDKDTSMSLGVGYYIKDNDISTDDGEISVDGDISRVWKIGRGSIRLNGAAGYENASFGSENLGFNVFYRGDVKGSYAFTRNLFGTLTTSYRYDTYNDEDDRKDRRMRAALGMNYRFGKWLSTSVNYSYEKLASTDSGNEYDDNRISFNVVMTPPRPIRMGN